MINLVDIARKHVEAFIAAQGYPTDQFEHMINAAESGEIPRSALSVSPEQLLKDPEAGRVLLDAFREFHPDLYDQFEKDGSLFERLGNQVRNGTYPY